MLPAIGARDLVRGLDRRRERGGYAHELYARSFSEFGAIVELKNAGARLIKRRIPQSDRLYDCIGCYPLFTYERLDCLAKDFDLLGKDVVSVGLVTDPWSGSEADILARFFDVVRPFKTHYLVDLNIPFNAYLHRHHRRYAKRSLLKAAVSMVEKPSHFAEEWVQLYQHLIVRHRIDGLAAFSQRALSLQLDVPGCHYFRAVLNGEPHGALVCFLDRDVAYAHLVSTTPEGQQESLQYALYWTAIEAFRGRAKWFALGSVPGLADVPVVTGLGFFKAGWATGVCRNYFCGRIQNHGEYSRLCQGRSQANSPFFPAYRS